MASLQPKREGPIQQYFVLQSTGEEREPTPYPGCRRRSIKQRRWTNILESIKHILRTVDAPTFGRHDRTDS